MSGRTESRYEAQKRRDWNTFRQFAKNHRPPLALSECSGAEVLEFIRYLDQFGKTRIHNVGCPLFGDPSASSNNSSSNSSNNSNSNTSDPSSSCGCPLKQAWGSVDSLVGRLRAAFDEHCDAGGAANPFAAPAVGAYLRELKRLQARARGTPAKAKRRRSRSGAMSRKQQQQQQQQLSNEEEQQQQQLNQLQLQQQLNQQDEEQQDFNQMEEDQELEEEACKEARSVSLSAEELSDG